MKFIIILAHPDKNSLNHFIADEIKSLLKNYKHKVILHDLYVEGFNPVMSYPEYKQKFPLDDLTQKHIKDVESSDGVIFIHPDWWGQTPAILKGWIDRVFRQGVAYDYEGEEFEEKEMIGLLEEHLFWTFITTNADSDSPGFILPKIWRHSIINYCGTDLKNCFVIDKTRHRSRFEIGELVEKSIKKFENQLLKSI